MCSAMIGGSSVTLLDMGVHPSAEIALPGVPGCW
jgi:hypothetical protein